MATATKTTAVATEPKRFRASMSILGAWASGRYDDAINMYLRREIEPTPAMIEGRRYHKLWENEINKTGHMPKIFGGRKLAKPFYAELKLEVIINDWLEFVGVIDVVEPEILTDFKTGTTPATGYSNSNQHKLYHVLVELARRRKGYKYLKLTPPSIFEYRAYNQHTKDVGMARVFLTPQTLKDGVEFLVTTAGEMKHYLEENGLL